MGEVVAFPQDHVVYNRLAGMDPVAVRTAIDTEKEKYIKFITKHLSLEVNDMIKDCGIDPTSLDFMKDMALVNDAIRALLFRYYGVSHPLHALSDQQAETSPSFQKFKSEFEEHNFPESDDDNPGPQYA